MEETTLLPKMMLKGNPLRPCAVEGCPGFHVARGYCMRHYCRIVRRGQTEVEAPGDLNPNKGERLTETEFCRLKDCRSQGFSPRDVAFELQKNQHVVDRAWECETFSVYLRGPEKAWPAVETL